MSHTAGGWNRNIAPASKYPIIYAGRNTHVAQVITRDLPESEAEANANLIAAAPDMLAKLEEAATWFEEYAQEHYSKGRSAPDSGEQHSRVSKSRIDSRRAKDIRATIAKALGR